MLITTNQWKKENPNNYGIHRKLQGADDESWIVLRANTDHPYPVAWGFKNDYPIMRMAFPDHDFRDLEFNGLTLSTAFLMMWKSNKGLTI